MVLSRLLVALPLLHRAQAGTQSSAQEGRTRNDDNYHLHLDECQISMSSHEVMRDVDCMLRRDERLGLAHLNIYPNKPVNEFEKCNVHFCNSTTENYRDLFPETHKGHLRLFGQQGQKYLQITEDDCTLSAPSFLKKYAYAHKPVVMRGCGSHVPAVQKWNNLEYLKNVSRSNFYPTIEAQKTVINNDRGPRVRETFHHFLDVGATKPWYVVEPLSVHDDTRPLREDILLPSQLKCTRTLHTFQGVHMWMSIQGGTQSSQHFDTHDNMMMQVSGKKTVLLTDPVESKNLYMDFHDKFGLSPVSVQKVDLNVFPAVRNATIYNATIGPGDLLYIPTHWWHVILSHDTDLTPGTKIEPNIAVNHEWHTWARDVDPSLKRIKPTSTAAGTAIQVKKLAESHRTNNAKLSADELCGPIIREGSDIGSSELPSADVYSSWWILGLPEVQSTDDFFNKWLTTRLKSAKIRQDTSIVRQICPFTFFFWFAEEKQGWLVVMSPSKRNPTKWPVIAQVNGKKYSKVKNAVKKMGKSGCYFHITNKNLFHKLVQSRSPAKGAMLWGDGNIKINNELVMTTHGVSGFSELPKCFGMLDMLGRDVYGEKLLHVLTYNEHRSETQIEPEWKVQQWLGGRRCDLEVVDGGSLTPSEFARRYSDRPVVIQNVTNNWAANKKWSRIEFSRLYGHATIPGSMARMSRDNSPVPVSEFIKKSREEHAVIYNYGDPKLNGGGDSKLLQYTAGDMIIPEMLVGASQDTTLSIGGGQGVSHQRHQVAWLNLVYGKKHWFVSPPNMDEPKAPTCDYAQDLRQPFGKVMQCVQLPGEVLWLPQQWWHATCNIAEWTIGQGGQVRADFNGHSALFVDVLQGWLRAPEAQNIGKELGLPEGQLALWSEIVRKYPMSEEVRRALSYGSTNSTFQSWLENALAGLKGERDNKRKAKITGTVKEEQIDEL